jgi:hypothetical protein
MYISLLLHRTATRNPSQPTPSPQRATTQAVAAPRTGSACALEVQEFRTVAAGRHTHWACACPGTCAVRYAPALLVLLHSDSAPVLPAPALGDSSSGVASLVSFGHRCGRHPCSQSSLGVASWVPCGRALVVLLQLSGGSAPSCV